MQHSNATPEKEKGHNATGLLADHTECPKNARTMPSIRILVSRCEPSYWKLHFTPCNCAKCFFLQCALELIKQANFLYTSELEGMTSTCFKALEGSNYDVRVCVAQLVGTLMATSQQIPSVSTSGKNKKTCSLEEVFAYMTGGFLRGGIGFLKGSGGELLKTIAPREVRVGVTQVTMHRCIDKVNYSSPIYAIFSYCVFLLFIVD